MFIMPYLTEHRQMQAQSFITETENRMNNVWRCLWVDSFSIHSVEPEFLGWEAPRFSICPSNFWKRFSLLKSYQLLDLIAIALSFTTSAGEIVQQIKFMHSCTGPELIITCKCSSGESSVIFCTPRAPM